MSLHLAQVGDHQFHLNTKDYLVNTSLEKSFLSHKRTGLVVHAKFASQLNVKSIDWVMLQRNVSNMGMRAVMNVPSVWWHYVLTVALDFIISTRIILLSIKSWKRQNNNNWLCSNIHAWHKITVSYNFIYVQLVSWLVFQKYLK